MIIEWILNILIALLKLPVALLNIPHVEVANVLDSLMPYIRMSYGFIRFFIDDIGMKIIAIALSVMGLFKVVDIIATIVGFFKKTG